MTYILELDEDWMIYDIPGYTDRIGNVV
jgi:hypothetical protein